jgi:CRP/FNR family transcriptional regulator
LLLFSRSAGIAKGEGNMDKTKPLLSKNTENEARYQTRLLRLPHGIQLFDRLGALKKIPKNTVFIKPEDPPRYCYVLKRGCVIGFEYTSRGDERIHDIILPPFMLLESCLLFNKPPPICFKTVKASELICIDRHTLLEQMTENLDIIMAVMESISYKFFVAKEQIRETVTRTMSWRFCNLLLMFAENYGVPSGQKVFIRDQISQQMLASLLGVNRITINRVYGKLRDMGLIEQTNGYYCVCDPERLKRHMEYLD